mgnify:CR=1 FL=1
MLSVDCFNGVLKIMRPSGGFVDKPNCFQQAYVFN